MKALAIYGNSVFIGGAFGMVDGATRNRLGAVRLIQGDLLPWNPDANGDVYAVDVSDNGTRVFVGGPFSTINGKDHYSLAMAEQHHRRGLRVPGRGGDPEADRHLHHPGEGHRHPRRQRVRSQRR